MAFVAITAAEITTGEPVSTATHTKIKDNFDDHESRLVDLETVGYKPYRFEAITGWHSGTGHSGVLNVATYEGMFYDVMSSAITLTAVRVTALGTGGGSTNEANILLSTDGGSSFNTILSASIGISASAFTTLSGTLTTTAISATDIFRLDGTFTGSPPAFLVRIEYTAA